MDAPSTEPMDVMTYVGEVVRGRTVNEINGCNDVKNEIIQFPDYP